MNLWKGEKGNKEPRTADVTRLVTCTNGQVGFLSLWSALPTSAEAGGLHSHRERPESRKLTVG